MERKALPTYSDEKLHLQIVEKDFFIFKKPESKAVPIGIALLIQTGMASQVVSGHLISVGAKLVITGVGALMALGACAVFPSSESSFVKSGNLLFKQIKPRNQEASLESKQLVPARG